MAELLTGVGIVLGLLVIIILIIIFSTLFMVQQQTMAIIERFGKFRRTAGAGLHIRAPFGIDRVIQRVHLRIKQNNILKPKQKTMFCPP